MIIRLVGSLVDLNSEGDYENYVPFADFNRNLNATPMQHCMDVSVEVDGAMPVPAFIVASFEAPSVKNNFYNISVLLLFWWCYKKYDGVNIINIWLLRRMLYICNYENGYRIILSPLLDSQYSKKMAKN